jgi:hypothetical protein
MNGLTIPVNIIGSTGKPLVEELQDCVNIYKQIEEARKAFAEEKKTYSYDIDQIEAGVQNVLSSKDNTWLPSFTFEIDGRFIRFDIYEVNEKGERK